MLKKILLCGLLALSSCAHKLPPIESPVVIDPPIIVMPEKHITWHKPGPLVGQEALAKNKMVMVFFYDSSLESTKLRKVFTNVCVIDQVEAHYIFVGMDTDRSSNALELLTAQGFKVPVVLFMLPDGDLIPVAAGVLPAATYCALLEKLNAEFQRQINGN